MWSRVPLRWHGAYGRARDTTPAGERAQLPLRLCRAGPPALTSQQARFPGATWLSGRCSVRAWRERAATTTGARGVGTAALRVMGRQALAVPHPGSWRSGVVLATLWCMPAPSAPRREGGHAAARTWLARPDTDGILGATIGGPSGGVRTSSPSLRCAQVAQHGQAREEVVTSSETRCRLVFASGGQEGLAGTSPTWPDRARALGRKPSGRTRRIPHGMLQAAPVGPARRAGRALPCPEGAFPRLVAPSSAGIAASAAVWHVLPERGCQHRFAGGDDRQGPGSGTSLR